MSTYTYRYIEQKVEMIDGCVWSFDKLPDPKDNLSKTFKINQWDLPEGVSRYYNAILKDGVAIWNPINSAGTKWVPVKWYSVVNKREYIIPGEESIMDYEEKKRFNVILPDGSSAIMREEFYWCDNGGYIRDDYISSRLGGSKFSGRGLPPDVSDCIKKDIESEKYHYDVTWVELSEWQAELDSEMEKFKADVKMRFSDEKIDALSDKIDEALALLKNKKYIKRKKKDEEDYFWEDSLDYLFEEQIWKPIQIQGEIETCNMLTDEFSKNHYGSVLGTRIIYYLA